VKALAVLAAFVLFLLAACTPAHAPPAQCEKRVRQIFHADTDFTVNERAALVAGADDLLGFTAGQVHQTLFFDLDFGSTSSVVAQSRAPMLVRTQSWTLPTQAVDARMSKRHGRPVHVWAWTMPEPVVRVFMVVDRIPAESFRYIAAHELAHAAGFAFPGCDPALEDCDHVSDPGSIMAPAYRGARSFSQHDLALCRASCLCP